MDLNNSNGIRRLLVQWPRNVLFWSVPEKHLQTLAALAFILHATILGVLLWLVLFYLAYSTTWGKFMLGVYLAWCYIDRKSCETGGRRGSWYRDAKIWKLFRDYFPVTLVKTTDLPPDKNYLLIGYPHGVLACGCFSMAATSALKFEEKFPGLRIYGATVSFLFNLPFIRECALASGSISVSRKSLECVLGKGKGRAALVLAGGAEEATYNQPGEYKILLERRKGFCKLALETGASLVPVFAFGETDMYRIVTFASGSLLHRLQMWVKRSFGFSPIIFRGDYVIIPRRSPITVVVGKPIKVEKVNDPSSEQIETLHRKFKESLVAQFNEGKGKYLKNPHTELIIV